MASMTQNSLQPFLALLNNQSSTYLPQQQEAVHSQNYYMNLLNNAYMKQNVSLKQLFLDIVSALIRIEPQQLLPSNKHHIIQTLIKIISVAL